VVPVVVVHASGAPALALRVTWQGHTIAYTGDTEWTEALVELAHGADLLIAEGYTHQRKIRFHLDLATLQQHAGRLGARRVLLTHLSLTCWHASMRSAGRPPATAGQWTFQRYGCEATCRGPGACDLQVSGPAVSKTFEEDAAGGEAC
jgi:phosphoribosyl 1,2-cyclic phosphodiesterase